MTAIDPDFAATADGAVVTHDPRLNPDIARDADGAGPIGWRVDAPIADRPERRLPLLARRGSARPTR